jgi:hypothetical protein
MKAKPEQERILLLNQFLASLLAYKEIYGLGGMIIVVLDEVQCIADRLDDVSTALDYKELLCCMRMNPDIKFIFTTSDKYFFS